MDKFFGTPFATTGDKTPIATTIQSDGTVSYPEGFGPDYQRDQTTDPDAKDVPRDKMNQLFYDLSNATREYQVSGTPDFITSALNGGTPFSYSKNARVRWTDGEIYESRINANTDAPTVSASWRKISGDITLNLIADAAGSVNAMTAAFTPSQTAYKKGVPLFIRAFGANTSGTPTLNVDGLGAKTICKGANNTLDPGDIAGGGFWAILQYDDALDKLVLANPAGSRKGIPGMPFDWPGATPPAGAVALPFVPTTQPRVGLYAGVFAAIGTAWGAGDGVNSFNIPYCPENYAWIAANGNVGAVSTGEVKAHSHTFMGVFGGGGANTVMTPESSGSLRSTNSTGGPANLAAGACMLKCMWL